jgi:hypothetical protein
LPLQIKKICLSEYQIKTFPIPARLKTQSRKIIKFTKNISSESFPPALKLNRKSLLSKQNNAKSIEPRRRPITQQVAHHGGKFPHPAVFFAITQQDRKNGRDARGASSIFSRPRLLRRGAENLTTPVEMRQPFIMVAHSPYILLNRLWLAKSGAPSSRTTLVTAIFPPYRAWGDAAQYTRGCADCLCNFSQAKTQVVAQVGRFFMLSGVAALGKCE